MMSNQLQTAMISGDYDAIVLAWERLAKQYGWQNGQSLLDSLNRAYRSQKNRGITCGYCSESYIPDGGWHCPHCGGC